VAFDAEKDAGHSQREEESEKLFLKKGEVQQDVEFAGPRRRYQARLKMTILSTERAKPVKDRNLVAALKSSLILLSKGARVQKVQVVQGRSQAVADE
jgi:hypothetical protein